MKYKALRSGVLPVRGSYVLIIRLATDRIIQAGRLEHLNFLSGYYAYVGSALGGLPARLKRHLRQDKKIHWHIDYLLRKAAVDKIIVCGTADKIECRVAQLISRRFNSISGFGSSDCGCLSHLFYSPTDFTDGIMTLIGSLDIKPVLVSTASIRSLMDG